MVAESSFEVVKMTKEIHVKDFNHFQELVIEWADERNMFCPENGATVGSQYAKLMEEVGKLGEGLINNDKEMIKGAIGNCAVVLVVMAKLADFRWRERMFPTSGKKSFGTVMAICADIHRFFQVDQDDFRYSVESLRCYLEVFASQKALSFLDCCQCAYNEINAYRIRGGAK